MLLHRSMYVHLKKTQGIIFLGRLLEGELLGQGICMCHKIASQREYSNIYKWEFLFSPILSPTGYYESFQSLPI